MLFRRHRKTRRAITGESIKNRNAFPSLIAASILCKAKFNKKINDKNDITIRTIKEEKEPPYEVILRAEIWR
jgi:hypothetical protein